MFEPRFKKRGPFVGTCEGFPGVSEVGQPTASETTDVRSTPEVYRVTVSLCDTGDTGRDPRDMYFVEVRVYTSTNPPVFIPQVLV